MSEQLGLFRTVDGPVDIIRSPLCSYQRHCGAKAALGPPEREEGCINRSIVCLHCGARGVQSTNLLTTTPARD